MTNVIELAKQAGIEFQENTGITGRKKVTTYGSQPIEKIELLIKLVRNAALEEAAQYCHDASIPQPDQIHTDAQWAAACLAVNLRNLKEPTP